MFDSSRILLAAAGTATFWMLLLTLHEARGRDWLAVVGCVPSVRAPADVPPPQRSHWHHTYENVKADPYSCDFSFLPGAWTGSTAAASATLTSQRGMLRPASLQVHRRGQIDGNSSGGSPLYGTAETQRIIWAHQHPADCRNQSFLIHSLQERAGIGAQLHVVGLALAIAMDTNRILLLDTDVEAALYTKDPYCGPERYNLDECYFERLSNCTLADMEASTNLSTKTAPTVSVGNIHMANVKVVADHGGGRMFAIGEGLHNGTLKFFPERLRSLVERSPVVPRKRYYWWRSQAAMYVVRPNERTRARLAKIREQRLQHRLPSHAAAISVHVRHGDKWKEAPEQPNANYFNRAQQIHAEANGTLQQQIFLSTDDPAAVTWFEENAAGWQVSYTNSSRKPDPKKSTIEYAHERGYAAEYLDSLLNLELAVECGGWVGTLTSNWCRLIDQIRSTARCKADGRYLDAAQEDPPEDIDWN